LELEFYYVIIKKTGLTFKFTQKDLNYMSQLLQPRYKDVSNNVIRLVSNLSYLILIILLIK